VDLDVPATLEVYGRTGPRDELLATVTVPPSLVVGAYADSVQIDLTAAQVNTLDSLVFVISSEDLECDETNNTLEWPGPFCR
jgi:hypothetical protein